MRRFHCEFRYCPYLAPLSVRAIQAPEWAANNSNALKSDRRKNQLCVLCFIHSTIFLLYSLQMMWIKEIKKLMCMVLELQRLIYVPIASVKYSECANHYNTWWYTYRFTLWNTLKLLFDRLGIWHSHFTTGVEKWQTAKEEMWQTNLINGGYDGGVI